MSTGGGQATVRSFPFQYGTPNLLTGATIYTPVAGEILLDCWLEIRTAFNGTTPLFDVGQFPSTTGWYATFGPGAVDASKADVTTAYTGLLTGAASGGTFPSLLSTATIISTAANARTAAPSKFATATPIKIVVSQDGTNTGASPANTAGVAIFHLITAAPLIEPWQG